MPHPSHTERLKERNLSIKQRFDELYKVKRVRKDDVLAMVAKEFWLSERTIMSVLKA
jgi:hypothetical protein